MAKANERAGWRRSRTRPIAAQTTEFGQRGRESRALLFRVSMLATLALMLMFFLYLVLTRRPDQKVPLIVATVSSSGVRSNADPLATAPNPFAAEDVELFQAWFAGGADDPEENLAIVGDPAESHGVMDYETGQLIRALIRPLQRAKPGGPDGDMLAIYLSAHGFVDRGELYFAVGDSVADDEGTWVKFADLYDEVLQTLESRKSEIPSARVTMFIDAARVGPQWDWGQFSESFAQECEQVSATHADRIAVVLSASSGQRSWWNPRSGKGLFPEVLVDALTSDRGDGDRDGVLTVGEISDYLARQVAEAADTIWDARQQPVLVTPSARDWSFIRTPYEQEPPKLADVDVEQLRSDLESVDELWTRHNRLVLKTHPPLAFDPIGWAALEKKLARLDALALSGKGYATGFQTLRSQCESDLTRFESGPDSMPTVDALPELALRDYFFEISEPSQEFRDMVAQWGKKPEIAAVQIPIDEAQAARFLWSWLNDKSFDPNSIALAAELLDAKNLVTQDQPPLLIESFFTRLWSANDLSHLTSDQIQTFVETHASSREAICADDLRATFWIRKRLRDANRLRLATIDQLLSRDEDRQVEGRDLWRQDVQLQFQSLSERAKKTSAAYQLRDRMLHAIPRIAETLLSDPGAFRDLEQLPGQQSRKVVARSIDSLSRLVRSLRLPEDSVPIESFENDIETAAGESRGAFDVLEKHISDRVNAATTQKASDARGLRQNLALLAGSGTSNAEHRRRIHERLVELIGDPSGGTGGVQSGIDGSSPSSGDSDLDMMAVDGKHLWSHWLDATDSFASPTPASGPSGGENPMTPSADALADAFDKSGVRFRESVSELVAGNLPGGLTASALMEDPIVQSERNASVPEIRGKLETADTYLRSRTVLFSHAPESVARVARGRFALDQQLFLLDHAARMMDEFWCEARQGDKRFFADAANRLLLSRKQNPYFSSLSTQLDGGSLRDRLTRATEATATASALRPVPDEAFREGTLLSFVQGKDVRFVMERPEPIPVGFASVWSQVDDQASTVDLGASGEATLSFPIAVSESLSAEDTSIDASVFFRGLRRRGEIVLKALTGGQRTEFRLPEYGPPTASVERAKAETERLLIVMDCSRSMLDLDGGQSRLQIAKRAVKTFLVQLQRQNPEIEVGLIVFGDRYGFVERDNTIRAVKDASDNNKYKLRVEQVSPEGAKSAGMVLGNEDVPYNPNLDVRLVVGLNRLDARHLGGLNGAITGLQSIGVTPTYRAIAQAYKQLGRQSGHIVVLTDGKPLVIGVDESVVVNDMRDEAVRLFENRSDDIRLTIVKYQNVDKTLDKAFPQADFIVAANGNTLLRHLQSVRPNPTVVWQENQEDASSEASFGVPVRISQWPPRGVAVSEGQPVLPAHSYSIRTSVPARGKAPSRHSAQVRTEGGERFEMILDDGGLSHKPFDYAGTQLRPIHAELADAGRFRISAGAIGKRTNRQLTLRIAIESARGGRGDGRFSPKPSDIWVELTGVSRRQSSQRARETLTFCLPEFELDRPIPILLCRIDDFPAQYDHIEVKTWMRFGQERLPGASIVLDEPGETTVDGIDGVTFRTERGVNASGGIRIKVTEQYRDGRAPGTVRVLSDPLPNTASTVLFDDKQVVVRTFNFDDPSVRVSLSAINAEDVRSASSIFASGTVPIDFDSR